VHAVDDDGEVGVKDRNNLNGAGEAGRSDDEKAIGKFSKVNLKQLLEANG